MTTKVLFVCLGNICRSPTAHAVFQKMVDDKNLANSVSVDSAGTGDWHLNHAPDKRAQAAAGKRGYDLSSLRSRLVTVDDFAHFDYVIAMDKSNLKNLQAMKPKNYKGRLGLLLSYSDSEVEEVPDPFYDKDDQFDYVLDLVEGACSSLLTSIEQVAEA